MVMIKMAEEELEALNEKMNNHDKKVICPRCGNEIVYVSSGNSEEVYCKTKGCISKSFRGI